MHSVNLPTVIPSRARRTLHFLADFWLFFTARTVISVAITLITWILIQEEVWFSIQIDHSARPFGLAVLTGHSGAKFRCFPTLNRHSSRSSTATWTQTVWVSNWGISIPIGRDLHAHRSEWPLSLQQFSIIRKFETYTSKLQVQKASSKVWNSKLKNIRMLKFQILKGFHSKVFSQNTFGIFRSSFSERSECLSKRLLCASD